MYQLLAEPALVQSVAESARQAVIALLVGAAVGVAAYRALGAIAPIIRALGRRR